MQWLHRGHFRRPRSIEAHLGGKYLLRSSDPTLSAEDIALGSKQLLQVERGWRDLKSTLDLRPVYHRREDRIRAHVLLCWLALLLIRIIEHESGDTWRNIRNEPQRLHLGTFAAPPAPASNAPSSPPSNATSCAPSSSPSLRASRAWTQRGRNGHSVAVVEPSGLPSTASCCWNRVRRARPQPRTR